MVSVAERVPELVPVTAVALAADPTSSAAA